VILNKLFWGDEQGESYLSTGSELPENEAGPFSTG